MTHGFWGVWGMEKSATNDVIWETEPVKWCKIDILIYWYHVKVWIIFFPELFTWISSDTSIKSYWFSKAIKIKKNIRIMMFISFILQLQPLRHVTGLLRSHYLNNCNLDASYFCYSFWLHKEINDVLAYTFCVSLIVVFVTMVTDHISLNIFLTIHFQL